MSALLRSADHLATRLLALINRVKERRLRWQRPLLLTAAAIFAVGCAISIDHLDLERRQLHFAPLLAVALIFVPLTIVYSAINMMVMARAANVRMSLWHGIQVTIYAQAAELLPVPGGAVVRTVALMKAGGKASQSAELVVLFSLLWIACAACGAGIALKDQFAPLAILGGGGAAAVLVTFGWIVVRYGPKIAIAALVLRVAGLALTGWRLVASFAIIGVGISFVSSFAFAFSTIAGSASSIAPGGLGIGESFAAILAGPAGVAPAAAFFAAALSRLLGVAICMLLALLFAMIRPGGGGFTSNGPALGWNKADGRS